MVILSCKPLENFLFAADLNYHFSAAWAVEFTEKDTLPCAELQRPAFNEDLFATADQGAFAVRVRIAFGMSVTRTVLGQQFFECQKHIVRNGWIGVLVDSDRCCSVGTIHKNIAVSDTALTDKRTDLAGNINHLVPAFCADAKIFLYNAHYANVLII